jgi:site-specific recombinase XerC
MMLLAQHSIVRHNDDINLDAWLSRYPRTTARVYRADMEEFVRWGRAHAGGGGLRGCIAWAESLKSRGLSSASVARKVSAVRSFFSFLCKTGEIETNPAEHLTAPPVHNERRDRLTREDIELMVSFSENQRDRAVLLLLAELGLRRHEVAQLRWGNVVRLTDGRTIIRFIGKGGRDRELPLSRAMVGEIMQLAELRPLGPEEPIFTDPAGRPLSANAIYDLVKKYAFKAHLNKGVSPHSFRHFVTTDAYLATGDATAVMAITGHKHVSTIQRYIHVDTLNTVSEIQRKRGIL